MSLENSFPKKTEKSNSENANEALRARFLKYARRTILLCGLSYGAYTAKQHLDVDDYSQYEMFNEAFSKARHDGEKKFEWKGKKYTTELVDKEISDVYFDSKDFLQKYYESDYFKNKLIGLRDTLNIIFDSHETQRNALESTELGKKIDSNIGLTDAEFDQYFAQCDELNQKFETIDSYASTKEFSEKISVLKDSLSSVYQKNLFAKTYFSITDEKGNDSSDGFYKRSSKQIYIHQDNPKNTNDVTTPVHELSHKSTDGDSMLLYTNDIYYTIFERYLASLNKMKESQDFSTLEKYNDVIIDYLASPTEIDARQNATRFWLYKNFKNYAPSTVFTTEHYDFLYKNYATLPPDIKQLMDVFPDRNFFIENMNLF